MSDGRNKLDTIYERYVDRRKIKGEFLPLNRITVSRAGFNNNGMKLCPYYNGVRNCVRVLGIEFAELESAEHFCGVVTSKAGEEIPYSFCTLLVRMLKNRLTGIDDLPEKERATVVLIAREAYLKSSKGGYRDDSEAKVLKWVRKQQSDLTFDVANLSPRNCSGTSP